MSGEEEAEGKPTSALVEAAMRYFKKEGYKVEQDAASMEGFSGSSSKFDMILSKGRVEQGVWIRDWKRTIGVNVIIKLDQACEDVGLATPIIVGEKFSDHAKSYANRRKIMLLTKRQITQSLR